MTNNLYTIQIYYTSVFEQWTWYENNAIIIVLYPQTQHTILNLRCAYIFELPLFTLGAHVQEGYCTILSVCQSVCLSITTLSCSNSDTWMYTHIVYNIKTLSCPTHSHAHSIHAKKSVAERKKRKKEIKKHLNTLTVTYV